MDNPFTTIKVDSLSKVVEVGSLLKSVKVDSSFTVIKVDNPFTVVKVDILSKVVKLDNPFMVFIEDIQIQAIVVELLRCKRVDHIEAKDNRMVKVLLTLAFHKS